MGIGELNVNFRMPKVLEDSSALLMPLRQPSTESKAMAPVPVAEDSEQVAQSRAVMLTHLQPRDWMRPRVLKKTARQLHTDTGIFREFTEVVLKRLQLLHRCCPSGASTGVAGSGCWGE